MQDNAKYTIMKTELLNLVSQGLTHCGNPPFRNSFSLIQLTKVHRFQEELP